MANASFVGSAGILDIPAPNWITNDDYLSPKWGSLLLALVKSATIKSCRRNDVLQLEENELGLLIEGGLFAVEQDNSSDARTLLVQLLQRGDLFQGRIGDSLRMTYLPHGRTRCLVISKDALQAFKADFPEYERLIPLLTADTAEAYANAVKDTRGRDQERIVRVLNLMARHPTASDCDFGREIEAGKKLIRDLAGVQKRSASRAFSSIVDAKLASFYGYKRVFFKV